MMMSTTRYHAKTNRERTRVGGMIEKYLPLDIINLAAPHRGVKRDESR